MCIRIYYVIRTQITYYIIEKTFENIELIYYVFCGNVQINYEYASM